MHFPMFKLNLIHEAIFMLIHVTTSACCVKRFCILGVACAGGLHWKSIASADFCL